GERLDGVEAGHPGVLIGYRASFPEIEVKVLATGKDGADAETRMQAAAAEVRQRLTDIIVNEGDETLIQIVSRALRDKKRTLALAESCTGGLVAQQLTAAAGASDFFLGGVVAYANSAKSAFLDVPKELIEKHGAVSEEVAQAMAVGAQSRFGA